MTQPSPSAHPTRTEVHHDRRTLRQLLIQQRRQVDPALRQQWDQSLMRQLLAWCKKEKPRSIAVYAPIQHEPDIQGCYSTLSEMGIQVAFPLVVRKNAPLLFLAWEPNEVMTTDEFGIPVPLQRDRIVTPEVILIPCVGFTQEKYRLGYGGGFYDRTLSQLPSARSIGIAYQNQQCTFTPGEHDLPMTIILTEHID
ncbi:5-formyltetrahydrofolate cyclo-ligase [Undibacterium sp. MH2W]|uniref:5-formyltetrahydrofolate cyclo-ligase n=1 Tax=Undibacterium sp. MH2W TaxID=3413044 RepID=UPI003BF0C22B